MYDVIVIGAGPAGLTAGIYLARAGKKVLILEKETIGGQMSSSPLIENYPGYEKISGSELALKMYNQALDLGVDIEIEEVTKVLKNKVITEDNKYDAKVIIIATGAKYRHLNIAGEDDLIGSGIHFCVSCDGSFYKGKTVAVIGGANSAATNALYLSDICNKVYLIYRKDKLKCEDVVYKRLLNKDNIEILYNSTVEKLYGTDSLESIDVKTNDKISNLKVDGIFEAIGMIPETDVTGNLLKKDDHNYYEHQNTKTEVDNIFVIGDCTNKDLRQITTAVSDGAIAATHAIEYLNKGI